MWQLLGRVHAVPYWTRALFLVSVLTMVAMAELALCGRRAARWKEYGAWVAFAALGALFGAANDLITSALSPAYFELGKGLPHGPQLVFSAVDLGARAGTAGGLLLGGILLMANNPGAAHPPLPYRQLALTALVPVAAAVVIAPLFALGSSFDLQGLEHELNKVLSASDVRAFLLVQRAHLGAYAGAGVGGVGAVLLVRHLRRSAGHPCDPCVSNSVRPMSVERSDFIP